MNKQKKTYTLLLAVLAVWGLIGYQIYKRMSPSVAKQETYMAHNRFVPQKLTENSFYELKENYRDPFLGKFPVKKKVIKKKIVKPVVVVVPFPKITYNGIIQANASKSYILTVNGQQEMLQLGESVKEVKLISANAEKAVVKFKGTRKTITVGK